MTWPEEFSYGYDEWTAGVTADIGFYVELAREADGPIVELADGQRPRCGAIAVATGRPVIGVDTSPAMLDAARRRADEAGVELILRLGDMAELELDEPASLIICPFRALLHVPTWAARRRLFERVAASLCPGGRFAWNAFAFDHHFAARADGLRVVDGAVRPYRPFLRRRQSGRHRLGHGSDEFAVVGDQERMAWPHRRCWPRS